MCRVDNKKLALIACELYIVQNSSTNDYFTCKSTAPHSYWCIL